MGAIIFTFYLFTLSPLNHLFTLSPLKAIFSPFHPFTFESHLFTFSPFHPFTFESHLFTFSPFHPFTFKPSFHPLQQKKRTHKCVLFLMVVNLFYFTLSTIALKAWGLLTARSASTLRLISIPALCNAPIRVE